MTMRARTPIGRPSFAGSATSCSYSSRTPSTCITYPQRDRVEGGLRTTVYDNAIRVDNVQHGLLAVMDTLETFRAADYRIEAP